MKVLSKRWSIEACAIVATYWQALGLSSLMGIPSLRVRPRFRSCPPGYCDALGDGLFELMLRCLLSRAPLQVFAAIL